MSAFDPSLADTEPPLKASPGIAQALALIAYVVAALGGLTLTIELFKVLTGAAVDPFANMVVCQLIAWTITLWIGSRWCGVRFREAFPLGAFPLRIVPAVITGSVGSAIVLSAVAYAIPMPEWIRQALYGSLENSSATTLLLSVVVAAPVLEELFFRGLLLRGFLARYSETKAIAANVLLFALIHLNPWQAVPALALGVICIWVTLRTRSLGPAILVHLVHNFTAVFLMEPLSNGLGYDGAALRAMRHVPTPLVVAGGVCALAGFYLLARQLRSPRVEGTG